MNVFIRERISLSESSNLRIAHAQLNSYIDTLQINEKIYYTQINFTSTTRTKSIHGVRKEIRPVVVLISV
jgi:hypothetical protein